MNTVLEYLDNTYLYQSTAKVVRVGEAEKGKYFVLDKTIFYPQGGGQPSDTGYVEASGENRQFISLDLKMVRSCISQTVLT